MPTPPSPNVVTPVMRRRAAPRKDAAPAGVLDDERRDSKDGGHFFAKVSKRAETLHWRCGGYCCSWVLGSSVPSLTQVKYWWLRSESSGWLLM